MLKLCDFLLDLIDHQIQKCFRIVNLGVGPNSLSSAFLVKEEVDALIHLAMTLEASDSNDIDSQDQVREALKIMMFYVDQEAFRVQAAILSSDNPPHRKAEELVISYQQKLQDLCQLYAIDHHTLLGDASLPLTLKAYRCKCAMVSLLDIDLILGLSSPPMSAVVADVIKENSVPNGYYEQHRSAILAFQARCHQIIKESAIQDNLHPKLEQFPVANCADILKNWKSQLATLLNEPLFQE